MDSLTHVVLGAVIGQLVLGKKLGNRALGWGAVVASLPDIDVLANSFLDTAGELKHHRGFTHSIVFAGLLVWLLASQLPKHWKHLKKKEKVTPARAGVFAALAIGSHLLIDCFSVYGTQLLSPFTDYKVSFGNLFIIDPLFTLPLLIVVLRFIWWPKTDPRRQAWAAWGIGIAFAYAGISFGAKHIAAAAFERDLARRHISVKRRMEGATAFNILLWRSVAERDDELWVGYRSLLDPEDRPIVWTVYPRHTEVFGNLIETREGKILNWFSEGWWIARPGTEGVWVADLHFGDVMSEGKQGASDRQPSFAWLINPARGGDLLRTKMGRPKDTGDALSRLFRRAFGGEEPKVQRLSGIPGSLPEPLRVIE